jgi:hypothetical protein
MLNQLTSISECQISNEYEDRHGVGHEHVLVHLHFSRSLFMFMSVGMYCYYSIEIFRTSFYVNSIDKYFNIYIIKSFLYFYSYGVGWGGGQYTENSTQYTYIFSLKEVLRQI